MELKNILLKKIELLNLRMLIGSICDNYLEPNTKYEILKPYLEKERQLCKRR